MKSKKFCICADSHGDMIDNETGDAVIEFCKSFKPEIRIHAGDAWDFRNLRKGASDEEKASSLKDDWACGSDFLQRFFSGGKSNHFLFGNHDCRLHDFANSCSGLLRDYANDGIKRINTLLARLKVKSLPYDSALGILEIGHLKVLHGYHTGTNACRIHANVYSNCVFGHVHTIESAPVASLKPAEARSIGCLCRRDMDYVNKKTAKLRWGNGWAYGLSFEDGSYQLFQAQKINGGFYVAQNITKL